MSRNRTTAAVLMVIIGAWMLWLGTLDGLAAAVVCGIIFYLIVKKACKKPSD